MISKADKGNSIIITYQEEYHKKNHELHIQQQLQ